MDFDKNEKEFLEYIKTLEEKYKPNCDDSADSKLATKFWGGVTILSIDTFKERLKSGIKGRITKAVSSPVMEFQKKITPSTPAQTIMLGKCFIILKGKAR